jgi:hypothetical protein
VANYNANIVWIATSSVLNKKIEVKKKKIFSNANQYFIHFAIFGGSLPLF